MNKLQPTHVAAINEVADFCHQNAVAHGFHPEDDRIENFLPRMCMLEVSEIAERFEAYRNGTLVAACPKPTTEPITNEEEELADLIIRAFDYARKRNIDIGRAIALKHAYNLTRPFKHGKQA